MAEAKHAYCFILVCPHPPKFLLHPRVEQTVQCSNTRTHLPTPLSEPLLRHPVSTSGSDLEATSSTSSPAPSSPQYVSLSLSMFVCVKFCFVQMDTPTRVQAQPETFKPPVRVVVTQTHTQTQAQTHGQTAWSTRDHIRGDTCSPSSMISLNMPVITKRQEDPLHVELHTDVYTYTQTIPLSLCSTKKKKKITHTFHLLPPKPADCQASHKHGALPFTAPLQVQQCKHWKTKASVNLMLFLTNHTSRE